jgi:beta-lactamase regulating signal transducer with metallopeptidase domain/tetratricopeptide (TPR) repeat protein
MATLFELAARLQEAHAAEALLLLVVKVTLILLLARVVLLAMPHASAASRHIVATAALVAIVALPLLSVAVPRWNVLSARQQSVQRDIKERLLNEETSSVQPAAAADQSSPNRSTAVDATAEQRSAVTVGSALSVAKNFVPAEPLTAVERAFFVGRSTWKGMIVVALGVVALLLLSQMGLGMIGVWHVARHAQELDQDNALRELEYAREQLGLTMNVRLLRSSRISVPVIWGVRRPILLLPADVVTWPVDRLRVVLLHELAHLKRLDGVSLLVTRVAVSLFWFHPLAWTLERAGRSECERACDDLVLASGTRPSEYADHLLAIARSMPTFDPFRSVTLAMSRKSQLEGRLLSILQPEVARRVFSGRGVAIACAATIMIVAPVAAMRLGAEPVSKTKPAEHTTWNEAKVTTTTTGLEKASGHDAKSDSTVDVVEHVSRIEDFVIAHLGRLNSRMDRFASDPKTGEDWYDRAYDFYRSERYAEAAAAFHRAADLNYAPGKSLYNESCSYALLGDANRAVPALQQALARGWDDEEKIAEDSDFDPIRNDPRFKALMQAEVGGAVSRRERRAMERLQTLQQTADVTAHGDDWFDTGLDLIRLRKLDESIVAFEKAIAAGEKVSTSMFNIACAYSLKKDPANGLLWLDRAVEQGFSSREKLANDPDLTFLRTQPGFGSITQKAADLSLRGNDVEGRIRSFMFGEDGWKEAAAHHRLIAQKYPQSGHAWFNYGYTSLRAGDQPAAIDAFQHAVQLGYRTATSSYNLACSYALQGNRDQAFTWLRRAKDAGFELEDYLDDDDDLASLHGDPRFKALQEESGS